MINKIKLWWLKRRAKRLILDLTEHYMSYDCGGHLVDTISPYATDQKRRISAVWDEIMCLDPSAPPLTCDSHE